jgi:hypothetical protein
MDTLTDLDLDSGSESELKDVVLCIAVSIGYAMLLYGARFIKTTQHTSILSGQLWIKELLDGHDGHFYNELGLNKFVFHCLLTTLEMATGLRGT